MNVLKFELQLGTEDAHKDFDGYVAKVRQRIQNEIEKPLKHAFSAAAQSAQQGMGKVFNTSAVKEYDQRVKELAKSMAGAYGVEERHLLTAKKAIDALDAQAAKQEEILRLKEQQAAADNKAATRDFSSREGEKSAKDSGQFYKEQFEKEEQLAKLKKSLEKEAIYDAQESTEQRKQIVENYYAQYYKLVQKASTLTKEQFDEEVKAFQEKYQEELRLDQKQYQAVKRAQNLKFQSFDATNDQILKLEQDTVNQIIALYAKAGQMSGVALDRGLEKIMQDARTQLSLLNREAAKSGAGFGSLNNNLYQFGQAIEDFNVGYQLNGFIGGLRGASNNVAFLAAQLSNPYAGLIATLSLTAVQLGLMTYEMLENSKAAEQQERSIFKLKDTLKGLIESQLDYIKDSQEASRRAAQEGIDAFLESGSRLKKIQDAAFDVQDATTYFNTLNSGMQVYDQMIEAVDLLVQARLDLDRIRTAESFDTDNLDPDFYRDQIAEQTEEIRKHEEAVKKLKEQYKQLADAIGLPQVGSDIERYAMLSAVPKESLKKKQREELEKLEEALGAVRDAAKDAEKALEDALRGQRSAALADTLAQSVKDIVESTKQLENNDAGQAASKRIEEILGRRNVEASKLQFELEQIQERLTQGISEDEGKQLSERRNKLLEEFVKLYASARDEVDEFTSAVGRAQMATDVLLDQAKEQLKTAQQAVREEERKLELYQKQLQTIEQQRRAAQQQTQFGVVQANENLFASATQDKIKKIQEQAEAYKNYVTQQAAYQNNLASAFGTQGVDPSGAIAQIEAQAQAAIKAEENKLKAFQNAANAQREQITYLEAKRQEGLASAAGDPEKQLEFLDAAIKEYEKLRALQLQQTSQGGKLGQQKKQEYMDTSREIDKLYAKQKAIAEQASIQAAADKQDAEIRVKELEAHLTMMNDLKQQLADKDIVKDLDVQRAQAIEKSLLAAQQALKAGDTGSLLQSLGQALGLPGFAKGGTFDGTTPIVVGEQGPEIIMPKAGGLVLTNKESRSLMNSVFGSQTSGRGSSVNTSIGTVNIMAAPAVSSNNLATQLRNSRYAARTRKR